ncbi:AMP-binding protein [Morganella morganii]|uniref:AMP-binding protein n=1 Tax=Morganella morganii TaxID=582 RepID=UPI0030FE9936
MVIYRPPGGLLHDGFRLKVQSRPNAVALIHGGRCLSYAALDRLVRCCAGALVTQGVQPGDRVAISMSGGHRSNRGSTGHSVRRCGIRTGVFGSAAGAVVHHLPECRSASGAGMPR